jgi:hypothetical protein
MFAESKEFYCCVRGITFNMGHEIAERVVNDIADEPEYITLFAAFSRHPSYEVRCNVASMTHLDPETVRFLSKDSCEEVVCSLMHSKAAQKYLLCNELLELAKRSPKIAETIANNFGDYEEADDELREFLFTHPDPKVRSELIRRMNRIPKQLIIKQIDDEDFNVSNSARSSLR